MNELDEHSIVRDIQQGFSVLLEDGESDLEEDLWTHSDEAVDDSEGEDERHRVDEETQEPATGLRADANASAKKVEAGRRTRKDER
jgi:hypothetical protein